MTTKREQANTEKVLVSALTRACETAKAEIVGFSWLTHQVDYQVFPESLQVVWIFDTQAQLAQALEIGQGKRMYELTAEAFEEAGISVNVVSAHVRFDSEEECERTSGGNWQSRLAMLRSASR